MSNLSKLFKYTFKYPLNIIVGLLAMFGNVVAGFMIPLLMITIIDVAIPTENQTLLFQTGGYMLGLAFFGLLLGLINTYNSQKVALYAITDLRQDFFKKTLSLTSKSIDSFKASRLITTATNDMVRIQQFFQMLLRIIVRAPLMVGIGIYMAIRTSTELSTLFFITIPLLLITIVVIMIIAFPRFKKVQKTIDGLNKTALETANAPRVIKSFVTMEHENKKFNEANERFRNTNTAAQKVIVIAEPIIMAIFNMSLAGLVFLGAYYIDKGLLLNATTNDPNVGVIIAFNSYSMFILFGLMMFAMMMIFISRAEVSAKRINEVFNKEAFKQPASPLISDEISGDITFENVTFSYNKDSNPALIDINITIKSGEKIGVIGSTGSGKSTLIKLLPRLYEVTEGKLLIDGLDIKSYDIKALRSQISIVTQKPKIFSGSIATNILQGTSNHTFDHLKNASEQADAYEFVQTYDDYFNHLTQQNGSNLSGGQKQRISLARGLIKQPKILVLDDSTSAVDAKSEAEILANIHQYNQDITAIIISQKISTIKNLDKILVLNNDGKVNGFAPHKDLLKTSTVYQEIAKSQIGYGGALNDGQ